MNEAVRKVSLEEYRRKSVIPPIVGLISVFFSFMLIGVGLLLALQVFSWTMMGWHGDIQQQLEKERKERVETLQQQYDQSTDEQEKERLLKRIHAEQTRTLVPNLVNVSRHLGSKSFLPFMAVLTAVFLLLGILFFFASIALLFRLRFSGWVYSALCVAYLLWWSTGTIACLVSYNGIISRLLSGAFFQTAPGGEADVEQVISRGYALSFAVGEVLSLVFAIAFFGGMLYLVNRREVREELRRRPPGDAEQWEAL